MGKQNAEPPARRWLVPAAVLGLAAVLVAVVLFQRGGDGERPPPAAADPDAVRQGDAAAPDDGGVDLRELERRDPDDLLAAGELDAPVGLVVFSDYQCPFCASWSHETLPELLKYVEAGELRIEWRDVNVFGEVSERAARASYAAALQGHFWEYHDALFPDGDTLPTADLGQDALVDLAADLGLDAQKFTSDMADPATRSQIDENAREGLDIGAHSTPAFILGGQPILGAQPTQVFIDTMDAALDAAGE